MKRYIGVLFFLLLAIHSFCLHIDINNPELMTQIRKLPEKPFAILITSYNNEQYAKDNLLSVINQHYSNYRVIFINDCSSDKTLEIVQSTIKECHAEDKVMVIDNKERKLGLRNYYEGITYYTKDEEIIVCVDGDDFLADEEVLHVLNAVYSSPDREIWMTYGQFRLCSDNTWGWNREIPPHIVESNAFRHFFPRPTHLRTFYSWLFKRIRVNDLKYDGHFFEMTWDLAFMFPMLEMSNQRFAFIINGLYLYNDLNPINDRKVNQGLQSFYTGWIIGMPRYKRLNHSTFSSCEDKACIICNKAISSEIYENNN